ncbi:MAG: hypothetical protein K2J60_18435, partial [Acetatifactor sp.]|nr:hypothetical protein [Acetatifactor sp.]
MGGQINDQVLASMNEFKQIPLFEFRSGTSAWQTQEKILDEEVISERSATEMELEKERKEAKENSLKERSYNALILRTFPPLREYAGARIETTEDGREIRLDAPNYINPLLSNKEWKAQYRSWKRESKKILAKEAKLERKREEREEKARNRIYKELGSKKVMKDGKEVKEQRLVDSEDVRDLFLDASKEAREKWVSAKMGRTNLTRRDIIMQVGKGDYSNFENLDDTMRNMFAKEALDRMVARYTPEGKSLFDCEPEDICEAIRKEGGVSALLDAPLRLGLSLAQNENKFYEQDRQKSWFRRLDEQMSAAVMLETLKQKNEDELKTQIADEFMEKQKMKRKDALKSAQG